MRATSESFKHGNRIGLFAVEYCGEPPIPLQIGGNFLNNEPLTFDRTQWNAAKTLHWSEKAYDFYAFYSYQTLNSVDAQLFEIAHD
ncbi:fimbrillin family protein [Alistipes sp.]|uniref:fimbrillin family protein n=1 Tax=Alistipes sp. TaxID=1872444 RepID=UPI003AB094C4